MGLDLERFRLKNKARTEDVFHPIDEWSPTDWATAMAGECGEACNLIKKLPRGDDIKTEDIADEIADMVTYADLLCERLGISLSDAIVRKFNKVSYKTGSTAKAGFYDE